MNGNVTIASKYISENIVRETYTAVPNNDYSFLKWIIHQQPDSYDITYTHEYDIKAPQTIEMKLLRAIFE